MVPRAVFVCVCTLSISSTLGSKSWHWHKPSSNQQSAHGLCITICTLTHRPHCISFPSTLSLAHSLVLSVWSCCVLLFILDLLVLLSSSSLSSSSSPSGPGIEKNSPNHQYHHPDSRSSNPLPTSYYSPATIPLTHLTPRASHLTPQTTNLRLHPNSDPFFESPAQNHPTRVQIRVRSAHCQSQSHDARGSRYPACACVGGLLSSSSLGT